MSYNTTRIDRDLFAAINSTIHLGLFLFLNLPSILLGALCIVALLLAKNTERKIKAAIINISSAEVTIALGTSIFYIGYPLRVTGNDPSSISCYLGSSVVILGFNANLIAIAIYAIEVYVLTKYNIRRLKWSAIVASITASWVVCLTMSVVINSNIELGHNNGFCINTSETVPAMVLAFYALFALLMLATLCIVIVFNILIFCYIRRNVSEENTRVHKATLKILAYHSAKMSVFFFQFIIGAILPSLRRSIDNFIVLVVVEYVFIDFIYSSATLLSPIVSLKVTKPLRDAIKEVWEKCPCRRQSATNSPPQPAAEMELQTYTQTRGPSH